MNPLFEAIRLMNKEEARSFKLNTKKVAVSGVRKDLLLYDKIRKMKPPFDEEIIFRSIYPEGSRNTFHRLKSRLLIDVNRCQIDLYAENHDTLKLYRLLSIVDFYLWKRHFGLANWFLRKAERQATAMDHREGLDIIYNEYIRLSIEVPEINPEDYIELRKQNQEEIAKIRRLDDILATATYRTKVAQTYGESGKELMEMLEKTVTEFAENDNSIQNNQTLQIKLFQAISKILLDRRDYLMLEVYLLETYAVFQEKEIFNRSTHNIRLQLLTYLVNAFHKNEKLEESLKYAQDLGLEMKEYDGLLYTRYIFFYYNSLMINYFRLDIDKAIALLEEMQGKPEIMDTPFYVMFTQMNLALAFNQKQELKKAIKTLVAIYRLPAYEAADPGMKLRMAIAEIMIREKLDDYEVLERRIEQIKREFKRPLRKEGFRREKALLGLIQKLNQSIDPKKEKKILAQARKFLALESSEEEKDAELIEYDEFVRARTGL